VAAETQERPPLAEQPAALLGKPVAAAFVAPALALIAVFLIFPALWTLYLGLTNETLTGPAAANPEIVGLENYTTTLRDSAFANSLVVTLLFVLGSAVIGQLGLGFLLAWKLRTLPRAVRQLVETLVILAWILPSTVVAFLWRAFLDGEQGTLNSLLGLDTEWLLEHPLLSIVVFNTWRGTAFSLLLCSAALSAVPPSHLETARLAGASGWQTLRDVVLPTIRGHLLTNLLLISLWTFNDFGPFLITAGGPDGATEILPVYVFNNAIRFGELGFGAAVSAIMLAINLVIALLYLRLLRRRDRSAPEEPAARAAHDVAGVHT
jgi:multiple sugar transport system permease protein